MRKLGVFVAVLGVLLLAAAAVLRFAVVPAQAQLPDDESTTRTYSGTAATALNATALAGGDLANAVLRNLPIDVQREVKVLDTDGRRAIVSDVRTVTTETGDAIARTEDRYAVDRKDLGEAAPFGDQEVADHHGLTISFPIGTDQRNYRGWQSDTQQTVVLTYTGEEKRDGLTLYTFTSEMPLTPITNEQVLAGLPAGLPKVMLPALAAQFGLPAPAVAQIEKALPTLPALLPITYSFEGQSSYWVEPTTGVVVDVDKSETRSAGIPALGTAFANLPILSMTTAQTDESVSEAMDDARSAKDDLALFGTTLPLMLAVVGLLLLVVTPFLYRKVLPDDQWTEDRLAADKAASR